MKRKIWKSQAEASGVPTSGWPDLSLCLLPQEGPHTLPLPGARVQRLWYLLQRDLLLPQPWVPWEPWTGQSLTEEAADQPRKREHRARVGLAAETMKGAQQGHSSGAWAGAWVWNSLEEAAQAPCHCPVVWYCRWTLPFLPQPRQDGVRLERRRCIQDIIYWFKLTCKTNTVSTFVCLLTFSCVKLTGILTSNPFSILYCTIKLTLKKSLNPNIKKKVSGIIRSFREKRTIHLRYKALVSGKGVHKWKKLLWVTMLTENAGILEWAEFG